MFCNGIDYKISVSGSWRFFQTDHQKLPNDVAFAAAGSYDTVLDGFQNIILYHYG